MSTHPSPRYSPIAALFKPSVFNRKLATLINKGLAINILGIVFSIKVYLFNKTLIYNFIRIIYKVSVKKEKLGKLPT